jgi:urea transport system substrate-binding protein
MRVALATLGVLALALLVVAGVVWFNGTGLAAARPPIRVGLLHSMTGPMAISERSMVDAETLAIETVNAGGGLLGRRVEGVVADGRSDPSVFAREAERLINEEKVAVIFGCWSSACRKAVKAVVERAEHLLVYPVAYEGLEQSPNIVYTGATANQQFIPAVSWCLNTLNAKRILLVGSDTVGPHTVNAVVKDQLTALGASPAGEVYLPSGTSDVGAALEAVEKAKPDLILSSIEGDTNLPFYQKFRSGAGANLREVPILSFYITEDEMRQLPTRDMTNDYVVCNYFQAIDREENREFVRRFKARFGQDRVTNDAIATAYNSVMLWAQAVDEVESLNVREDLQGLLRQSLSAPEGVISVDRQTQHTYRPFFIGRVRGDGQVDIVLTLAKPVRPVPFPTFRSRQDWDAFLASLRPTPGAPAGTGGPGAAPPAGR